MRRAPLLAALVLAACGGTDNTHYVVVSVDWPAAVHDATSLTITLGNAGTSRTDTLSVAGKTPPVEFSVSAPGRTGDLTIAVDASTASGTVGRGTASAKLSDARARVTLDATDFVVNTDFAGDQQPDDNIDDGGLQLAARDDQWTVAFRSCPTASDSCDMFGRTFDAAGKPVQTEAAAGTNEYPISTMPSSKQSNPVIAAGPASTLVVWDYASPEDLKTLGIACRSFDAKGRPGDTQTTTTISAEPTITAAVAPLATGNFLATWTVYSNDPANPTHQQIHGSIIKPDCTPLLVPATPFTIAAPVGVDGDRSVVAVNGDAVLYAWLEGTLMINAFLPPADLHVRVGSTTAAPAGADVTLLRKTATEGVSYARLAPAPGGGFTLAVRWSNLTTATAPGRIELYQLSAAGAITSGPLVITDKTTSDLNTDAEAIAVTTRMADGVTLVAWHACGDNGDGNECGVFGQFVTGGALVGDRFTIPTTTTGDQTLPSVGALADAFVAVWSDKSAAAPDIAGSAVRARILYPPGADRPATAWLGDMTF